MKGQGTAATAGGEGADTPTAAGRRPLTPDELHARRVEWGREYGQLMRTIKRHREERGS